MKGASAVARSSESMRSERFHLWRSRKDRAVRWAIAAGGISVILAVVLIFFYLLWVVIPLFLPADIRPVEERVIPGWEDSSARLVSVEEQQEVGLRLSDAGEIMFFNVSSGEELRTERLPLDEGDGVVLATNAVDAFGHVAAASDSGDVLVFRHQYETRFPGGVETREIVPELTFPYGATPLLDMPSGDLAGLAVSDTDEGLLLAAADRSGLVRINAGEKSANFLTGEVTLEPNIRETRVEFTVTGLAVSGDHRWLYLADDTGRVHRFNVPALELQQTIAVAESGISAMVMLLGGISLLTGDQDGGIQQLFPVRGADGDRRLELIRRFDSLDAPIVRLLPEERRKGFVALTARNELGFFHSTAKRLVARLSLAELQPDEIALSPRADSLLAVSGGRLGHLEIHNEHPEVSFSSLWRKVWYENYSEPAYIWQSSAANNEFEPKFSLTPLVFGTIKAAAYAMLFAIPLALMGAAYTAYFMSPELRKWVKPGIEIMAALPTVILGFLAGLWFAPWVEEHLVDLFTMLLLVPPGLLAFSWGWHRFFSNRDDPVPEGWEPLLLVPPMILLVLASGWLGDPLQNLLFGGDLRTWLSNEAGISYDQRNALVVGCAMGFAVIPTIFSIAEDAVFGVPKSLSDGSLALGATPWQTLLFVILPTASPGIFSALMIGLGRAVGETMIVLMATGNTPVMDWNLFEGMRTLAANIAVEMPESEVNSTHYRILFLAALVLFLFTFVVNTAAELVRQRLREKYSSL
jgi:phosphate transport system permease protein